MNKRLQAILKLARQVKNHNLVVLNYFGNLMRHIGGGEKAVVRARLASPELAAARNNYVKADVRSSLAATGLIGGLGAGAFLVTPGDSDSDQASIVEETPQQYMYDPDSGWMEYNEETGQYEALQPGFGIDRFGNTNYYDGTNWLSPDLYIQGSNGLIYDKATGQIIGNDDAMLAARNSGYNNIFDYRAALEGYDNPEYIKVLQLELGVTADGKWVGKHRMLLIGRDF